MHCYWWCGVEVLILGRMEVVRLSLWSTEVGSLFWEWRGWCAHVWGGGGWCAHVWSGWGCCAQVGSEGAGVHWLGQACDGVLVAGEPGVRLLFRGDRLHTRMVRCLRYLLI